MTYGDRKADRVRFEHRYPVNLMGVDGTWRQTLRHARRILHRRQT